MTCAPWHLLKNLPYRVLSPAWGARIQRRTLYWIDTYASTKGVRSSEGHEDDSIWGVFLEILIQWVWNNVWEFVYLRNSQLVYILGKFGIIAEWIQRNQGFLSLFLFVCLFFDSTRDRLLCLGLVVIFYPWKCLLLAKCLACWWSCSGVPIRPVKFCLKKIIYKLFRILGLLCMCCIWLWWKPSYPFIRMLPEMPEYIGVHCFFCVSTVEFFPSPCDDSAFEDVCFVHLWTRTWCQGFPSDVLVQKDTKTTHFMQSCFGLSGLLQQME